ncbi:MAG: DUF6607 family protein [Bacteroidota bacterium]
MRKITLMSLILVSGLAYGQKKKKQDVEAILSQTGCYEVTFNFAETFAPDKDYEFHKNYRSGGIEYVHPVVQEKDKIVLQHLLIIGDSMIIKHWRQDWLYENTDIYAFDKEATWKYESLNKSDVTGQWTQKVYQVDDSPRYEGSASWVHVDGRHYWESTVDAPLPRREFSKRSDYNVMKRRNRQELTDNGWVHEQDNDKIVREGSDDELLASEKGWNTYEKIDESKCQLAKTWWSDNEVYWADVRAVWDELFAMKETIAFNIKVDEKIMFQRLFALGDEVAGAENYNSEETKGKIKDIIQLHLKSDIQLAKR